MFDFVTIKVIWENLEFAVMMLGVLSWLAAGWLFWDGYLLNKKQFSLIFKVIGMFLMAIGNVIYVWDVKGDSNWHLIFYVLGLLTVGWGFAREPVLETPKEMKKSKSIITPNKKQKSLNAVLFPVVNLAFIPLAAFLSLMNSLILFVKVKQGLDKQFRLLMIVFFTFGLAQLINVIKTFFNSNWPYWLLMSEEISILSAFKLFLFAVSYLLLLIWVWKFIKFRIGPQLFLIMSVSLMIVFVIMTGLLTHMSINRIQEDAFESMTQSNKVLKYALESKAELAISNAKTIGQDNKIIESIKTSDSKSLIEMGKIYLDDLTLSRMMIIDDKGVVIARADDRESAGDNVSNNSLYKRAMQGSVISGLNLQKQGVNNELSIQAFVPIISDQKIIGVVDVEYLVDEALVDSLKTITGLNTAIYAGDVLIATTLWDRDSRINMIGQPLKNREMKKTIFDNKEIYTGSMILNNTTYIVSASPVLSYDQLTIGALMVARPEFEFWSDINQFYRTIFIAITILYVLLLPIIRFLSMRMEEYFAV